MDVTHDDYALIDSGDARKLERELGWKPAETFETGIRKTVVWYLENQAWVSNVTSGAYKQWLGKQYGAAA